MPLCTNFNFLWGAYFFISFFIPFCSTFNILEPPASFVTKCMRGKAAYSCKKIFLLNNRFSVHMHVLKLCRAVANKGVCEHSFHFQRYHEPVWLIPSSSCNRLPLLFTVKTSAKKGTTILRNPRWCCNIWTPPCWSLPRFRHHHLRFFKI